MTYVWDEAKRRANIAKHGLDFSIVARFDWATAARSVDDRVDYGELREIAIGYVGDILCVLIFTQRGNAIRVISIRRATRSEARRYANDPR